MLPLKEGCEWQITTAGVEVDITFANDKMPSKTNCPHGNASGISLILTAFSRSDIDRVEFKH